MRGVRLGSTLFPGISGWVGAKPNAGHFRCAARCDTGKVGHVITQNVDDLHQDAVLPTHRVIEFHGNAGYATCLICGLRHELDELRDPFLEQGTLPACRACGGIVKSATISFGQPMPVEAMRRAEAASRECDLFIVLGSSLVVYPAATLPRVAKANGAALAIINRSRPTWTPRPTSSCTLRSALCCEKSCPDACHDLRLQPGSACCIAAGWGFR